MRTAVDYVLTRLLIVESTLNRFLRKETRCDGHVGVDGNEAARGGHRKPEVPKVIEPRWLRSVFDTLNNPVPCNKPTSLDVLERVVSRTPRNIPVAFSCRLGAQTHGEAVVGSTYGMWQGQLRIAMAVASRMLIQHESSYKIVRAALTWRTEFRGRLQHA